MDIKGYHHIPQALFHMIIFRVKFLPKRLVSTFLDLLFGTMLKAPVKAGMDREVKGLSMAKSSDQP